MYGKVCLQEDEEWTAAWGPEGDIQQKRMGCSVNWTSQRAESSAGILDPEEVNSFRRLISHI